MKDYFLLFSSHFDRDKGLDWGRLSLNSLSYGTVDIWIATSSHATKQGAESFHYRGGLLPPQYRCPQLKNWFVETNPLPLPTTKGVEGNFYRICPFEVTTDRGGKRSDFGIHLDANNPGSMGCIVMDKLRFSNFELRMLRLKKTGLLAVPLFVQYS